MSNIDRLTSTTRYAQVNRVLTELGAGEFTPPTPTEGGVTGTYSSDATFNLTRWDEPLRSYISEALDALDRIHDTENMPSGEGGQTLQQVMTENNMYSVGRPLIRNLYPAAHLLFLTGAPAIPLVFQDLLDRYMDNSDHEDAYGNEMRNWSFAKDESSSYTDTVVRLEDSLCSAALAIMVRVVYENNGDYQRGLDALKGAWQRWEDGAWEGGGSTTHADPSLDRPFAHTIAARANMAWHLWKITGNANYKTGFDTLMNREFSTIGKVVGQSRMSSSFGNQPGGNSTDEALPLTYARYAFTLLYALYVEGAFEQFSTFDIGDYRRGIHHYLLRDADTNGGLRQDMCGTCASGCGATSLTVDAYNGSGLHSFDPARFQDRHDLDSWGLYFWFASPESDVLRDAAAAERTASSEVYTQLVSWPMTLIVANWEEPA